MTGGFASLLLIAAFVHFRTCDGFDWVTRPDTVHACVGGDAQFPWRYDPAVYDVEMVYWRFKKTKKTVLAHHLRPVNEVVAYNEDVYKGRAFIMEDVNAGLLLKQVTDADEGKYSVELSGVSGGIDTATLMVHTDAELKADMRIDNLEITPGEFLDKSLHTVITVTISTAKDLRAHLIIDIGGDETHCSNETLCASTLTLDHSSPEQVKVRFLVNYDICQVQDETVYIKKPVIEATTIGEGGTGTESGNKATGIIIGIVVVVVFVVLILVGLFFCLKHKRNRRNELAPWEEKYIGCCVKVEPPPSPTPPKQEPAIVISEIQKEKFVLVEGIIRRLLLEYHKQKLSDIQDQYAASKVNIKPGTKHQEEGLLITSSTQDDLDDAVDDAQKLIADVIEHQHKLVNTKILTDAGKSYLNQLEQKHKVTHCVESTNVLPIAHRDDRAMGAPQDTGTEGKFVLGKVTLEVKQGDLTEQRDDAIVNSTVATLEFQGAVAHSILKKGGRDIETECKQLVTKNGPINCTAMTGAGSLACKCIIHLDTTSEDYTWGERILSVLKLAKNHNMTSVAFPAFGTGKLNPIPASDVVPLMYKGIKEFCEPDPGSVTHISIVAYEESNKDKFLFYINKMHSGDDLIIKSINDSRAAPGVYPLNNVTLTVKQGDLTQSTTDAIVNGTNARFVITGAVSKAIASKGGPSIFDECKKIGYMSKVHVTGAGRLACDAVIHLDTQDSGRDWEQRIYDVVQLAEDKKFKSVACPAFGTGKLAQIDNIASMMYRGVRRFAKDNPGSSVTDVQIVAFAPVDERTFNKEISILHESLPNMFKEESRPDEPNPIEATKHTLKIFALSQQAVDEVVRNVENFSEDALAAATDMVEDYRVEEIEGAKESDRLLGTGEWSYKGRSGFQPYSRHVNQKIEDAFRRKEPSVSWDAEEGTCMINFQDMEEVLESNPNLKVKVRRK